MKTLAATAILCLIAALINAAVAVMMGSIGNTIAAVILLFAACASYWQLRKWK